MKKVCIRGNEENPEKVIEFLESIGGLNKNVWEGDCTGSMYYLTETGFISESNSIHIGYTEISFTDACAILDGKAVLNDDCTVTYIPQFLELTEPHHVNLCDCTVTRKPEPPKFPCQMWVWDGDIKDCAYREVHGYIPTLAYCWIAKNYITSDAVGWKNASITDPRMPELTIEEAEKKFNIKIKRQ